MARIAIVGAGLSGLTAGVRLQLAGHEVRVFEKSRGPGGRMATRRAESGERFDHGAQYFTARDPRFISDLAGWVQRGVAAEWSGQIVQIGPQGVAPLVDQPQRYVGIPAMKSIAAELAHMLPVEFQTRIVGLVAHQQGWELQGEKGRIEGHFDRVLLTLPAPQSAELLDDSPLVSVCNQVTMTPCWAILLSFGERVPVEWDGAFVNGSESQDAVFSWVARNSSKPGRATNPECWVLHASPRWSQLHRDGDRVSIMERLVSEFENLIGRRLPAISHRDAQRWLYSASPQPLQQLAVADDRGRAICGDWLAGGRVEGAYLSGLHAAEIWNRV